MLKLGNNYTKVCGVAYDFTDIKRIIDFSIKKGYRYYYIKHIGINDLESGDNHKEHFHFIIESNSQHRFIIDSLITDNFKPNLFEKLDNTKSYLRYMTHIDYDDKEHYEISDIVSNVPIADIEYMVNDIIIDKQKVNKENFNFIVNLILTNELDSFRNVMRFCQDNNIEYCCNWTNTIINLLKGV